MAGNISEEGIRLELRPCRFRSVQLLLPSPDGPGCLSVGADRKDGIQLLDGQKVRPRLFRHSGDGKSQSLENFRELRNKFLCLPVRQPYKKEILVSEIRGRQRWR